METVFQFFESFLGGRKKSNDIAKKRQEKKDGWKTTANTKSAPSKWMLQGEGERVKKNIHDWHRKGGKPWKWRLKNGKTPVYQTAPPRLGGKGRAKLQEEENSARDWGVKEKGKGAELGKRLAKQSRPGVIQHTGVAAEKGGEKKTRTPPGEKKTT